MQKNLTLIDVRKLQRRLRRVQIACSAAIQLGDCSLVARLTCEAARIKQWLDLVGAVRLGT